MSNLHPAETLLIEGPDATAFAHAQFSSKVNLLDVGRWQFSAWLDPQGRVRALFHLIRLDEERYLLLLRGGDATAMVDALQRFVFRSKLNLTALPPRVLATGPAQAMHAISNDNEVISLGCETHSLRIMTSGTGDGAWRLMQLHEGWPWLPASIQGKLLPAALSLQRLQAVAVDKGCYPGQEIVARLHFRGGHKRHLHSGTLSQPASAGDSLRVDDREVGCVIDVVESDRAIEALVVLSDDVVALAVDGYLSALDDYSVIRLGTSWPA